MVWSKAKKSVELYYFKVQVIDIISWYNHEDCEKEVTNKHARSLQKN